ncbi:MAG: response regulator [Bacteroidetes bacterium]|nr:response regulator [Bacteroidota bacterium]
MKVFHATNPHTESLGDPDISLPKEVWIIDDDEVDIFTIRKMFEIFIPNCTLVIFLSAREALERFQSTPSPAVILLDINLPAFTGWDFLSAIQQSPVTCPIYILTSSSSEIDEQRSKEYRVEGYLYKPLTKEVLQFINKAHNLSD